MPTVTQTSWADIVGALPDYRPWSDSYGSEAALLVVAAGFEERARAILQGEWWPEPGRLVVVEYPTNYEENRETRVAFENRHENATVIRYTKSSFVEDWRSYLNNNEGFSGKHIVVDVSGMSSYVFFGLMEGIFDICVNATLTIFYAEAEEYFPTKDDLDGLDKALGSAKDLLEKAEIFEKRNFQSRGIGSVYESEIFSGKNIGELPTRLVVVPNFSRDRTETMIARATALYNARRDEIVWLLGRPPNTDKNGWRLDGIGRLYFSDNRGIPISTLDYKDAARKLGDLWDNFEGTHHMLIVTLGSKMQHLGTFLFLKAHWDVGLFLSEPGEFVASRFSRGIGQAWTVHLGLVDDIRQLLRGCRRLTFEWS